MTDFGYAMGLYMTQDLSGLDISLGQPQAAGGCARPGPPVQSGAG